MECQKLATEQRPHGRFLKFTFCELAKWNCCCLIQVKCQLWKWNNETLQLTCASLNQSSENVQCTNSIENGPQSVKQQSLLYIESCCFSSISMQHSNVMFDDPFTAAWTYCIAYFVWLALIQHSMIFGGWIGLCEISLKNENEGFKLK